MAEPNELTPPELDRIEDALELLETDGVPEDLAPHVQARLASYRDILQMSRDALPMEDVPDGVLDAVFAEARGEGSSMATQESGVTATGVEDVRGTEERTGGGFWKQLRRTFAIPALALAGSAAIVLWVVSPEVGKVGETRTVDEATAAAEAPPAATPPASGAERAQAEDGPAAKLEEGEELEGTIAERAAAAEQAPVEEAVPEMEPEMAPEPAASPGATKPRPMPKRKKGADADMKDPFGGARYPEDKNTAPAKPSAPAPSSDGASVTWTQIADADRKRRAYRCGLARIIYRKATETPDSRIAARGHAGLGLCAEQGGESGAGSFARARKLDAGIEAFIADERRRAYRPGAKASKKKSKAAPPDAADEAVGETY